jgi:hypothetical protein
MNDVRYFVQCSICGCIEEVTEENSMNGEYPDGWIYNEDDFTLRCYKWECQDAELIDYDILDFYDVDDEIE